MKPKIPGTPHQEQMELDLAIDLLHEHRADQIAIAREIAEQMAAQFGTVTSSNVFAVMRMRGDLREDLDPRWMGAVFSGKRWERVGFVPNGSHRRPVSVWKLKENQ